MIKIDFKQDKFQTLMQILQIMKNQCDDITISSGNIFQENNFKNIVYSIDVSSLFGKNTVYFDRISFKYDLLDIFKRQLSNMVLEIHDKKYIWADKDSKLEFLIPAPVNLTLKPMDKDSARAKLSTTVSNEKIFECSFSQNIIERISATSRSLDTNEMVVSLSDDGAVFNLLMGGNNKSIMSKVLTVSELESDSYEGVLKYPISLFTTNVESINIQLFVNEKDDSKMTIKCESELNNIKITQWSTSPFKENK